MYEEILTFFSFSRNNCHERISSGPRYSGDLLKCLANSGGLLLVSGQRNPFDLDFAVQGVAVEKAETAYGLNVRRDLDFLFVQQEQLPRAERKSRSLRT